MATQACPNCQTLHDTRPYVSGQKLLCRCGIRFEVKRNDVSMVGRRPQGSMIQRAPEGLATAATDRNTSLGAAGNVTLAGGGALNLGSQPAESPGSPEPMVSRELLGSPEPVVSRESPRSPEAMVSREAPASSDSGDSPVVAGKAAEAQQPSAQQGAAPAGGNTSAPTMAGRPSALAMPRSPEPAAAQPGAEGLADTAMRQPFTPAPPAGGLKTPGGRLDSDLNATVVRAAEKGPEIPGYQLLDVLGRGGMGEVWRARQISLDRMVAVKVLPQSLSSDREFVARFEKEAQALASLSHPNIIQIIDRGVVGSNYFFVMEFVQGRSLRELIGAGPLPATEALRLIIQICHAIDYAHDRGIIHRDLKPENILLDERNHVKVADFGLASFVGNTVEKANLTATSVAMGTLNYMAPEQRRDAKSVDGRADLFSLGVILYELLTGELPLGRFKLPSERVGMDARLDRVIIRSLESDPEARYARASHIAVELESLLPGSASWPAASAAGGTAKPAALSTQASVIQKGWSGIRYGLTFIGALTLLAVLVRGPLDQYFPGRRAQASQGNARVELPPNTNHKLYAAATTSVASGAFSFHTSFQPPTSDADSQAINANDGQWTVEGGKLVGLQAGNLATKESLRPRAYLSRRYFTSDDFSAEVQMTYQALGPEYGVSPEAQVFEELSFRIAGSVTVSVFAIPDKGVRLLWAYNTVDGVEVVGNSAQDPNSLLDDEIPPPPDGVPFTVRLTLKRQKDGTLAEAFVNNRRVGRKLLVGLLDTTGKLAVGCRNLRCEFDDLKIKGEAVGRPKKRVAQGD